MIKTIEGYFNFILASFILVLCLPLLAIMFLFIKLTSSGPVIFKQIRYGHKRKKFNFYKFRTMIDNAPSLKGKYTSLNYADGPTFKIKNDPRFTKVGRFFSKSHLDELPQLWNVLKGDMKLVGFRPPVSEEVKKYNKKQLLRFNGYPGITSIWAINGGHDNYSFDSWIGSDVDYESKRSLYSDFLIFLKTISLYFRSS